MAKWAGVIGFVTQEEQLIDGEPSGVWKEVVVEKKYTGILNRLNINNRNVNTVNDQINISNQISIIANLYARNNFVTIRYATLMGHKFKVSSIEFSEDHRLLLTLGDLYNEESN